MRVPNDTVLGDAQVHVSVPDWKGHVVTPIQVVIPVVAEKPKATGK